MVWNEKWALWNSCCLKINLKSSFYVRVQAPVTFVEGKGSLHVCSHLTFSLKQEFFPFTATHARLAGQWASMDSSGALGLQRYATISSLMKVLRIRTQVLTLHGRHPYSSVSPAHVLGFGENSCEASSWCIFPDCASEDKTEPPWGFDRPWTSQELPVMCSWPKPANGTRADHVLLCVRPAVQPCPSSPSSLSRHACSQGLHGFSSLQPCLLSWP